MIGGGSLCGAQASFQAWAPPRLCVLATGCGE
jgi:hypothetical protein